MDNKIMGMIDAEVAKLPRKHRKKRFREYQYLAGRETLCLMFPGRDEHEYICKAVSKKYGI